MALLKLVFCLTCLFFGKMAQETGREISTLSQKRSFISADVGNDVTLQCFYEGTNSERLFWYKQTLGQEPKLISTFHVFDTRKTFYYEFKDNPRFNLDAGNGKNHLMISDLNISDSATYYCAESYMFVLRFAEGTVVSVQGSGLKYQAVVHQSESEIIQPGSSVTLSCTVQTGTCDGGHSVYWFRDSEESHSGLIYTHGDRDDQCERKADTQTHACVYNLPMTNLKHSHTGTYYCAITLCGHILFGNGTKLQVELNSRVLVYVLSGALVFTTIVSLLLAFNIHAITKRNSCKYAESHARNPDPSTMVQQNEENIHYAALEEHKVNRARRQRNNTNDECVYSSVKVQN